MKVSFDQIKEITRGAAWIEEQDGSVQFHRFTKEQEELYRVTNEEFYIKSKSSTGVRMVFKTDSRTLGLSVNAYVSSTRHFFSVDVLVNGEPVGYLENYTDRLWSDSTRDPYWTNFFPLGDFSKTFDLGEGEKTVEVWFPWSVGMYLKEMTLEDGASLQPVKAARKAILFGDSITHGYDTRRALGAYSALLTQALDADARNKGIGGEEFFPALAQVKDEGFDPDIITVAYGTNDWSHKTQEKFRENCRGFYKALSENYPNAKIFALTPIWRDDCRDYREFGNFDLTETFIRELTADLPNVICIRGFDLVPHDISLYADAFLHPNEAGFEIYFRNLYKEMEAYL